MIKVLVCKIGVTYFPIIRGGGGGKIFLESSSVLGRAKGGTIYDRNFKWVFGPRNQTGSEPCPARKMPLLSEVQIGSSTSRVLNCSFRSPDHFDISIHGSTMKIEDTRAIIEGAVDSCDAF